MAFPLFTFANTIVRYQDEAKTLDQKRESYIKLIREKMAEDKNADSSLVFAPFNSKEVKGMNYQEVVSSLADAGFTNVTLETETDKAIIFKRTNEVDKITISGKTDFTTDDFFEKNAFVIHFIVCEFDST